MHEPQVKQKNSKRSFSHHAKAQDNGNNQPNYQNNPNISYKKHPLLYGQNEPEKLIHDQIILRERLNDYEEENIKLKTKIANQSKEMIKLQRVMDELGQQNINSGNRQIVQKWADSSSFYQLKLQNKDLKQMLDQKSEDIMKIKKLMKYSKLQEMEKESQIYLEEISKLTQILGVQQNQIINLTKVQQQAYELTNKFTQQMNMITTLKKDYNNIIELNKSLANSNQALSLSLQKKEHQLRNMNILKQQMQILQKQVREQTLQNTQVKIHQIKEKEVKKRPTTSYHKEPKVEELLIQIQKREEYIQQLESILQEQLGPQQSNSYDQNQLESNQQDTQNELNFIFNDIKYRLLCQQINRNSIIKTVKKITPSILTSKPFHLTMECANFVIQQLNNPNVQQFVDNIPEYQLYSQQDTNRLLNKLKQYMNAYKKSFVSFFGYLDHDQVNEEDIKNSFTHMCLDINDQEAEFIIYYTWTQLLAEQKNVVVECCINWNEIMKYFCEETKDEKVCRPYSANETKKMMNKQDSGFEALSESDELQKYEALNFDSDEDVEKKVKQFSQKKQKQLKKEDDSSTKNRENVKNMDDEDDEYAFQIGGQNYVF